MTFTLRGNKLEKAKNIRLVYKGLSRTSISSFARSIIYKENTVFNINTKCGHYLKNSWLLTLQVNKLEYDTNIRLGHKYLSGTNTFAYLQDFGLCLLEML